MILFRNKIKNSKFKNKKHFKTFDHKKKKLNHIHVCDCAKIKKQNKNYNNYLSLEYV